MTNSKRGKKPRLEPILFSDPARDADMKYFTRFDCCDPFLAFGCKGKKIAVTHGLEFTRMQKESCLDEVLEMGDTLKKVKKGLKKSKNTGKKPEPRLVDLIQWLQRERGIEGFRVPRSFPAWLLASMQKAKVTVEVCKGETFAARAIKTPEEVEMLREANAAAAAGQRAAVRALREATIGENDILRLDGRELTSERLRHIIDLACLEAGAVNVLPAIVAGGDQGVECHCIGSGPLKANELIIVDIFPRMAGTGYFGDMTRTYLKGKASPEQRRLVSAVKKAQKLAMDEIRDGASTRKPWKAANDYFKELGYETKKSDGEFFGFYHGLGHGLGLEVHEPPNMSRRKGGKLKAGHVVTVEPGLYYHDVGGCRVEDVVLVTEEGCELISKASYTLQIS